MWDKDNNVEYILKQDNREKRSANGEYHNSGRRGGGLHGIKQGIRMPNDVLKYNDKKAYKKYIGSGEIKMSNIYEDINNIPPIKDVKAKDYEAAKSIITAAREFHTSKELIEYWKISSGGLYSVYDKFGVIYQHRNRGKKDTSLPKGKDYKLAEKTA